MTQAKTLYVFTDATINGKQELVGKLVVDNGLGEFHYAPDWLSNSNAFALDPINLPLSSTPTKTKMNEGVFNVLLDSGPDKWGKQLMTRLQQKPPRDNIELLLYSSGGSGALHYSLSRSATSLRNRADSIYIAPDVLINYINTIQNNTELPSFIRAALFAGSSLGGARPKLLIRDLDGTEYIAKLNKEDDHLNVARIELSMLHLAKAIGIQVSPAKVNTLDGRDSFWIKRFDRVDGLNLHYISAHSLLNGHRWRTGDDGKHSSYAGIASVVRKISTHPKEDCLELYKRAALNILVGNTDDHLKNHGFVRDQNGYRLSPVFDIVPQINQTKLQAIGVGEDRTSTFDNLLLRHNDFYLTPEAAAKEISTVINTVTALVSGIFNANSVSQQDADIVLSIIKEKSQTACAPAFAALRENDHEQIHQVRNKRAP